MTDRTGQTDQSRPLILTLGHEQLRITRRYEIVSILNDFVIAVLFLAGSILFLSPALTEIGTWLFIIASFQFLMRPCIRLAHHFHIKEIPESNWDK